MGEHQEERTGWICRKVIKSESNQACQSSHLKRITKRPRPVLTNLSFSSYSENPGSRALGTRPLRRRQVAGMGTRRATATHFLSVAMWSSTHCRKPHGCEWTTVGRRALGSSSGATLVSHLDICVTKVVTCWLKNEPKPGLSFWPPGSLRRGSGKGNLMRDFRRYSQAWSV